jgi:mycofactocin system glycosyltransferase
VTAGLPAGWTIQLDPTTRRVDGGRVLIGGAPLRVLRLTEAGAAWLDRASAGEPLPAAAAHRQLARRLVDAGIAHPSPLPAGPEAVTAVVPVRDDAAGLARTLAAIGPVDKVIVVDDGSADARAIRMAAGAGAVLRNDRPGGPGAARQRGWLAAETPVVAFVDADIELPDGWLAPLLAHLGDAEVGAVAPRVVAGPGRAPAWLAGYELVRSPLDLGPAPGPVRPGGRVPYVPTATLVVRREALEAVGGFAEELRFGEDVDLVWRLVAAGWRVRYEPAVVVSHPSRPSLRTWVGQRVRYGSSAAPLTRRHPGAVAPLRISGWSGMAWAAVVAGRPLVGAGIGAGTTAALVPKLRGLDHPAREAVRLAGLGNVWAGRAVAEAIRRPWWPLALGLAAVSRRSRPALAASALAPLLLEWRERRPPLDPTRFTGLRLLDDMSYGAGVWLGCLQERSFAALRPAFTGPLRVG